MPYRKSCGQQRERLRLMVLARLRADPGRSSRDLWQELEGTCTISFRTFQRWLQQWRPAPPPRAISSPDWPLPREQRLRRVQRRLRVRRIASDEELRRVRGLVRSLLSMPHGRRQQALDDRRRKSLYSPAVAESLLLHTEERFVQNAREAESVGGLAWTILEGLGPQLPVNTLRALCQAFLGNCRRIAYDWHEARQRFERARFFLSRGNGDPLFSARIEELEAALLRDTGEYAEALELLASAAATYKAVGSHDSLGTILFRKAICLRMKGDRLEALDSMFSSLVYLDEEADAHLAVRARHELAVLLTDCGRHREAAAILHDGLDLEQRFGPDHVYVLHNAWAWGSTLFGLGRYDEARSRFEAAHRGFLKREDTDTASLLGLEMALFYLASGESSRAVQLARESCESLAGESLDTVSRRALASFMHLLTGRTLAIQEMYRQLRVVLERR